MRIYDLRENKPAPVIRGEIREVKDFDRTDGYEVAFLLDSGYDVRITQKEIEFALGQRKKEKKADG